MADVFVSHMNADRLIAMQIASCLEESGFSTWYYERDSLPGVSYLLQTAQAIQDSKAILLVISSHSLGSHQVTKEVVRGHEANKHFVPVLVDVSHAEFQNRQPEWREAVGAATSISLVERGVQASIRAIEQGLLALGIVPRVNKGFDSSDKTQTEPAPSETGERPPRRGSRADLERELISLEEIIHAAEVDTNARDVNTRFLSLKRRVSDRIRDTLGMEEAIRFSTITAPSFIEGQQARLISEARLCWSYLSSLVTKLT